MGGLQLFWMILIASVVAIVTRRIRAPYALALVVTGLAIGIPRLLPHARLDPTLLLTVFLPPILFEAAINLRTDALRKNWKPISVYSLAGTVLSTLIAGRLAAWALHLPLPVALVFGALISPTDPIAVIAVFRHLRASPRLTLIMEAESLLNDAVAVVLFVVLLAAQAGHHATVADAFWQFVKLSVGGALVGAAVGGLASRVHHNIDDHLVEITLTTVVAFGSYLAAEALHVSGVMAVVAAGLVIGNLGMPVSMSPGTRLSVSAFWEYAAFVVNSIVFLLIGIEVAYVHWADKILLAANAIVAVLIGRMAIYPLSWILNRMGGEVPLAWQHVLVWGGLRGALCMALALRLSDGFPRRDVLIAATFAVVAFSLLAQGLTVAPLLKWLRLAQEAPTDSADQGRLAAEMVACQAALLELERLRASAAHPSLSIEALMDRYRGRLEELEQVMDAEQPAFRAVQERETARARMRALQAEKSAYREARHRGWLREPDWQEISTRIDRELVELRAEGDR